MEEVMIVVGLRWRLVVDEVVVASDDPPVHGGGRLVDGGEQPGGGLRRLAESFVDIRTEGLEGGAVLQESQPGVRVPLLHPLHGGEDREELGEGEGGDTNPESESSRSPWARGGGEKCSEARSAR